MSDRDGYTALLAYCQSEFSAENILFVNAVLNEFRASPGVEIAKRIEATFIGSTAPAQVNLPMSVVDRIHETLKDLSATAHPHHHHHHTAASTSGIVIPVTPALPPPTQPVAAATHTGHTSVLATTASSASGADHTELAITSPVVTASGIHPLVPPSASSVAVHADSKVPASGGTEQLLPISGSVNSPTAAFAGVGASAATGQPPPPPPAVAVTVPRGGGLPPGFAAVFDLALIEVFQLVEADSFARWLRRPLSAPFAHLLVLAPTTPHPSRPSPALTPKAGGGAPHISLDVRHSNIATASHNGGGGGGKHHANKSLSVGGGGPIMIHPKPLSLAPPQPL